MGKIKTVRLLDIATKAGVSVSAVSKTMNGSDEIPETTREKILSIAREMDYHPNFSARSLRLGRSRIIGVIIPNNDFSYNHVLSGISKALEETDYTPIFISTKDDPKYEKSAIKKLLSIPVDGILSVPVSMDSYKNVFVPVVFMSRYPYRNPRTGEPVRTNDNYVVTDDYEGQRIATTELIKECGGNVYIFLGSENTRTVAGIKEHIRLSGYKKALEEQDIPFDEGHVYWNTTSLENACENTRKLLERVKPPFGLMVANDYFSIGVISTLLKNGYSIPDDVKIIGFDDLEMASYISPTLTTIHCSRYRLGSCATQHLVSIIQSKNTGEAIQTIFQPKFVKRSSM